MTGRLLPAGEVMTNTPKPPRKRPAVAITLSKPVLDSIDKRAKEAGLSRSRFIESILVAWAAQMPVADCNRRDREEE